MDRKRILAIGLSLFIVCGGTIALSNVNDPTIADIPAIPQQDTVEARTEAQDMINAQAEIQETVKAQAGTPEEGFLKVPLGDIVLKPPEGMKAKLKRSLVNFPHTKHFFGASCQDCHHKWEDDGKLQTCSAAKCHDKVERVKADGRNKPDPDIAILYYKKAYHQQCITCHKETKLQNRELALSLKQIKKKLPRIGPTGCVKCHPKDKEADIVAASDLSPPPAGIRGEQ